MVVAWLVLAGAAGLFASSTGLGKAFVALTMGLGTLASVIVLASLPARLPANSIGLANLITLARTLLTCLLAGTLGHALGEGKLAWAIFFTAALVLALDGIDGPIARRRNEASDFGGRFDMESDAFFVLVLALLACDLGKAGAWVLASGLLRYLFVAGGYLWPWLQRPLPASRRRRAICALQAGLLVAALTPILPPDLAGGLAAVGLAALTLSFALDSYWLYARRTGEGT